MYFEMYTVEMDGGRKVVSYDGYIWDGDETGREDGAACHLRFDYCNKLCAVPVSEKGADGMRLFELLMLEYEKCPQYSDPITDEEAAYMKEHRVELDADDVTLDTPCGKYWFRPDGENGVVLTHQGQVFDMETVAHYMDHDLAEDLHLELAPCRPQVFYEEYCKRHEERFGEEFRID